MVKSVIGKPAPIEASPKTVATQTKPCMPQFSSPVAAFLAPDSASLAMSRINSPESASQSADCLMLQHQLIFQDQNFLAEAVQVLVDQELAVKQLQAAIGEVFDDVSLHLDMAVLSKPSLSVAARLDGQELLPPCTVPRSPVSSPLQSLPGLRLPLVLPALEQSLLDRGSHHVSESDSDSIFFDVLADRSWPVVSKFSIDCVNNCSVQQSPVSLPNPEAHTSILQLGNLPKGICETTTDAGELDLVLESTNQPEPGIHSGSGFGGFNISPNQPNYLHRFVLARNRLSLSPIIAHLDEARSVIEEYRRRSRSRLLATYQRNLPDLPTSELVSESAGGFGLPATRQTRSRGPVADLPNVQPCVLEYMNTK